MSHITLCFHCLSYLAVKSKIEISVAFDGLHEFIGNCHGEIEIADGAVRFFETYKLEYVGMIDAEHAHIGAPPRTALFHYLCACVVDFQERAGTARYALCCAYRVTCRTEPVKTEARTAAHLVDKGRVLGGIEYVRHGILYGKHETGRHGEGLSPGIGERR